MLRTAAGLALLTAATAGMAQPFDYSGYGVVRVEITSAQDLELARSIGLRLYAERSGIGPVEYLASPTALERLSEVGLGFEMLDAQIGEKIDAERARLDAADQNLARATFFNDFRRYEDPQGQDVIDITDFINDLGAQFPDLVQVSDIGTTHEGRTIRGVLISGDIDGSDGVPTSSKPLIFINAGIHAREWISPSTASYIIDRLATTYGADPRVTNTLDRVAFFIIPSSNPDGYEYSHTTQRLWRKNRRNNGDGTFGVDLNRNFGFEWGGLGADTFTNSDIYRGPGPFSEPETQAIRDAALARPNTVAFIDVHSYSQLILYPWGYDVVLPDEPDLSTFVALSAGMRQTIESTSGVSYADIPSHDLYPASGTAEDWGYGGLGALGWTFELRPESANPGFQIPPSQILPVGEEIYEAFMYLADNVIAGVTFSIASGAPDRLMAGEPTPISFQAVPVVSGPLDSGSASISFRVVGDSDFQSIPATAGMAGVFSADLPPAECGDSVEYFLEIAATSGAVYRFPSEAPSTIFAAEAVLLDVSFEDSFASDLDWSVSGDAGDGQWTRGAPVGGDRGDPASDFDGNGFAYVTDNVAGNSDVDGGQTVLTSPRLDTSAGGEVTYAYWLNDVPNGQLGAEDFLAVETRSGSGAWDRVRTYTSASASWRTDALIVGDDIPQAPDAQLRVIAADLGQGHVVEAGFDAVTVSAEAPCPNACPADVNGDGILSGADFNAWLSAFQSQLPAGDQNGDGEFSGADFNAFIGNFGDGC